jgi:tetrahydromethanopterin S-methyltransferase subunit B
MDTHLLIILVFGIICFIVGGLTTFSDTFFRNIFPQKQDWTSFPETKKYWSQGGIYRYNRYGLGLGTFIIGISVIVAFIIKYFQL